MATDPVTEPQTAYPDPKSQADEVHNSQELGLREQALGRFRATQDQPPIYARYGLLLLLIALVIVFSILLPTKFPTSNNLSGMVSNQTVDIILVLGLLFPLIAGDFDLSIAASMILSSSVVTLLMNDWSVPPLLAAVVAILAAGVVGITNAALIVKLGLNAFIVTLGTMTIVEAISQAITHGQSVVVNNQALSDFFNHKFGSLPASTYIAWAFAIVIWYLLALTPFGRYLQVTGTARSAGRLAGVPTSGLRYFAFSFAALMAGFAGVILTATLGSVEASSAGDYLLSPYTLAFLGTAVVVLGRFTVPGALIAAYIVIVAVTGLELEGLSSWVTQLFQGGMLLLGLIASRLTSRARQSVIGHFG